VGSGEKLGLKRVARGLDRAYAKAHAPDVITCLEITAGQGSSLGYRLEHLAEIISASNVPEQLGVCLDTAHLFAAGYDFRGEKYGEFRKDLGRILGLKRVKVWHLNDSKKELGSRVDRHDHIGRGKIGVEGFIPIVCDEMFSGVPKILETPKEKEPESGRPWDEVNLEVLRGMMR
jgi:deoxyribonuclease-4